MSLDVSIEVSIAAQRLRLKQGRRSAREYRISTAKNGAGELKDSACTPRGRHVVCEKIGAGCAPNTVFVGRVPTGEIYRPALREHFPERDWILTRILWLAGVEPGRNQGENVDSRDRYIYIHGAPDDVAMGVPGSRGCVRMRNGDIIELFDQVAVGTEVVMFE